MVDKRYLQHVININGGNYRVETIKITVKQETEQFEASNNVEPYAVAFGKATYEIQLSGVDPEHRPKFMEWLNRLQQRRDGTAAGLLSVSTYSYNSKGELQLEYSFTKCFIEEISSENSTPFDVKMVALHRTK